LGAKFFRNGGQGRCQEDWSKTRRTGLQVGTREEKGGGVNYP